MVMRCDEIDFILQDLDYNGEICSKDGFGNSNG